MSRLVILVYSILLLGCVKERQNTENIIAKVYDDVLTAQELSENLPKNCSKQDSLALTKQYLKNWIKQKLFYRKAKLNLEHQPIDKLIAQYKEDLYISYYKNKLGNQNLDTLVKKKDIESFYAENKNVFVLNETLIKLSYIHLSNNNTDKLKIKELLETGKIGDKQKIISDFTHKDYFFNDSIWVSLKDIKNQKKNFPELSKINLATLNKVLQKPSNDNGLHYIKIKEVLKKDNIAPIEYVEPTIKSILLQQHKRDFYSKMEQVLINDAVKQGEYEIY